ncbi:MAG: NAD(P)/FAD-dependent oxidoreductase [Candidatus Bipolaricaulota bacterium]|nr:NAD(P)/FAD-dependent oxidoreductase [Candidatus Bipolaricaulota bacterium]
MQRYDVIVVGAGPAGATAAYSAARHGAKVLLLEEHTKIGRPIQCTGLLSLRGWRLARASDSIIVREITGVRVHSPDGSVYELGGDRVRAYVIDRDRFDQYLVERAAAAGVAIQTGTRAIQLRDYKNGARTLVTRTPAGAQQSFKASVIIGADGPHSILAQHAGLPRPQKMLLGLQAVIATPRLGPNPNPYLTRSLSACGEGQGEVKGTGDFVEVFFGRRWAANFFAWSVPAADGTARVGLLTEKFREAKLCFERLCAEYHSSGRILSYQSGMIPIGPARRTVADGFLVVGDAAGQAKPTSGGGIYTGMLCGKIAGEVAARCALTDRTRAHSLREYEKLWRAKLARELSLGMRAHQILSHLSDDQIAHALKLLALPQLRKLIERFGDIDYPSKIARELLKRPRLWSAVWPVVPAGLAQYVKSVWATTARM